MIPAPVCCLVLADSSCLFFSVISAIFFFCELLDLRPVAALPSTEFAAMAWIST